MSRLLLFHAAGWTRRASTSDPTMIPMCMKPASSARVGASAPHGHPARFLPAHSEENRLPDWSL